jgi:hypothetical protein
MRNFMVWWSLMAKHPAYGRARVLAILCAVDMAAMVYFSRSGEFGWVFPLIVVFFVLSSSCFEALGYAFQATTLLPVTDYTGEEEEEGWDWDSLIAALETEEKPGPQPQTIVLEDEFADYWEGDDDDPPQSAIGSHPLTEPQKLELCQFYSFLYAIVAHQVVGEKIWIERGMKQLKYRQWIHALAAPGVEITRVQDGKKPVVLVTDLQVALNRIINRLSKPDYWEFPFWYSHKQEGAGSNWETLYSFKRDDQAPPLLPCYPSKLKTNLVEHK